MSHSKDSDCTVGDNGCCTVCGAHHGEPCACCGARAFHVDGCADACGCSAGILIMNDTEIQRCDACNLFETDDDAAAAVGALLRVLATEYKRVQRTGGTVADAMDAIRDLR